jgi:hypothetical protein
MERKLKADSDGIRKIGKQENGISIWKPGSHEVAQVLSCVPAFLILLSYLGFLASRFS